MNYLKPGEKIITQAYLVSKWFNVCSIEYGISLYFAKTAVLQLYRRVFSPHHWSSFDIAIILMAVFLFMFHTAITIAKIFECNPRPKIHDLAIPGTCIDLPVFLTSIGVLNTITDTIILFLPIKAVWKMNMQFKKKAIVVLVFTFGLA